MRPGALAKFGLDYDAIAARHRALSTARSRPSARGSFAGAGGYDVAIQALSGMMAMTGHPGPTTCEDPGRGARLRKRAVRRRRNPGGARPARADRARAWVQTSLLQYAIGWLSMHVVPRLLGGDEPGARIRSPFFAPYEAYRTGDGYLVVVGTGGQDAWGYLCTTSAWNTSRTFASRRTPTGSATPRGLQRALEPVLETKPNAEWIALLGEAAGSRAHPCNHSPRCSNRNKCAELAMVRSLAHPAAGDVPTVRPCP